MTAGSGLAAKPRDAEELAQLSLAGSVDDLALLLAQHAGASHAKLRQVTGLPQPLLERALTNLSLRRKVTEALTLLRVTPAVEGRVLDRMIETVESPESSFGDFRVASDWLLQQGGVKRAERSEVETTHRIRVEFVSDPAEVEGGSGYRAPDPLAGVVRGAIGSGGEVVDAEYSVVDDAEGGS